MKTLFVGQNAIHLTAVGSTNSYASDLMRQIRVNDGTIVYTFEQTNGRGQRGNTWLSEPNKNIALSLILHPTFLHADEQFWLTKVVSLAVADLMAETLQKHADPEVKIKWPNDIYINGKKTAGILIENNLRDERIQSAVIGIGLNVNQTDFDYSINATSMKALSNEEFELVAIIERLCEFLEARYLQLKTGKRELLDTHYLHCLYRLGEWKNYKVNEELLEGKIGGVSKGGKLMVEDRLGGVREFDLKEIVFV